MSGVYPPGAVVHRDALISADGKYRYWLTRCWNPALAQATLVGLNPSTADHEADDPTIRREVGFAVALGCGGLVKLNLSAYRATDPTDLRRAGWPVGPDNDRWIETYARLAVGAGAPLIAAWGTNAPPGRVAAVRRIPGMQALLALGVTRSGQPRHPLYLPAAARPIPWPAVSV